MRSYLFVPGHNERLLASAKRSDADCLILDLEDSVPDKFRHKAVELVSKFKCDKPFYVRVKHISDIYFCGEATGIMIPKAERKFKIFMGYDIIPLIETTKGIMNAYEICKSPHIVAVAFGGEDFKTNLQGTDTYTARSMIAMTARAAGIDPIDTAYIDIHNPSGLYEHLTTSKSLGYRSMLCLHPKQIPLVHRHFTPSEREISQAQEIIRLSEIANKEGRGVAIMDGVFIGPPMVKRAQKILNSVSI